MNFQDAIKIVKEVLHNCGSDIKEEKYDGLIVKKLAASNTLDENRKSNQTHIALTGEQMDIFPYLCAEGYFFDGKRLVNEDLKKYFIIRVKTILTRSNCDYLGASGELSFATDEIESSACVVRSKRAAQSDQLQLSMLSSDGKEFVAFRKLLHEGSFLIVLKNRESMKYHLFGVKQTEENGKLSVLNNKFFRIASQTIVDTNVFEPDIDISDVTFKKDCLKGCNELYYGVPGAGKSYAIDQKINGAEYERVVFHPDYTYSDFVGQIMPKLKKDENGSEKLSYEFVPGPFTKALKSAEENPERMYYLIIEEINRGNAPAIFGDIFQLLDRNEDGSGKYHITNFDIAREVYGDENHEVILPSNLSILATMNTSDQNVFTLDTAFQRRWNMKYIDNDVMGAGHAGEKIEYSDITWGGFASTINDEILDYNAELSSSEDKQMGAYFVTETELTSDRFPEKALKYLWDDAFRLERDKIFRPEIKSIGALLQKYQFELQKKGDPLKAVIRADLYSRMLSSSASDTVTAADNEDFSDALTETESDGE